MASSDGKSVEQHLGKRKKQDDEKEFEEYHKKLAGIVKSLHSDLRQRVKQPNADVDKAWLEHCNDTARLREYSEAMHQLAVNVWEKQRSTRIDWCRDVSLEYFFKASGLRKVLEKEARRIAYCRMSCADSGAKQSNEHTTESSAKQITRNTTECDTESSCGGQSTECKLSTHSTEPITEDSSMDKNKISSGCRNEHSTGFSVPTEQNTKRRTKLATESSTECGTECSTECGTECGTECSTECGTECGTECSTEHDINQRSAESRTSAHNLSGPSIEEEEKNLVYDEILRGGLADSWPLREGEKIRLLDVGSCYDGFSGYEEFQTLAVDLCPAVGSVLQCDFLQLEVLPLNKNPQCDLTSSSTSCNVKQDKQRGDLTNEGNLLCHTTTAATTTTGFPCEATNSNSVKRIFSSLDYLDDQAPAAKNVFWCSNENVSSMSHYRSILNPADLNVDDHVAQNVCTTGSQSASNSDRTISHPGTKNISNPTSQINPNLNIVMENSPFDGKNLPKFSIQRVPSLSEDGASTLGDKIIPNPGRSFSKTAENTDFGFSNYLQTLQSPLTHLAEQCFHVVVFSLLLEYLPSPRQRLLCCDKAWRLLSGHGLLIIVTPDSHHAYRRSDMIRSWRQAIESLGFVRWRYVKEEHLHCMAFRKVLQPVESSGVAIGSNQKGCVHSKSYQRLSLDEIDARLLYIPQDNRHETIEDVEADCS